MSAPPPAPRPAPVERTTAELAGAELAGMRWPAVEQGVRRLLVVPVGSLEQQLLTG